MVKVLKGVLVVLIPLLFVVTMVILISNLLGFDYKKEAANIASGIPIVSHWVEQPKTTSAAATPTKDTEEMGKTISDLKAKIADNKKQLSAKNNQITKLQNQIDQLNTEKTNTATAQASAVDQKKAAVVAQTYQNMDPAKAAAILAIMKDQDAAKYLNMLGNSVKAKILEQLPAKKAAKLTPLLDVNPLDTQKTSS